MCVGSPFNFEEARPSRRRTPYVHSDGMYIETKPTLSDADGWTLVRLPSADNTKTVQCTNNAQWQCALRHAAHPHGPRGGLLLHKVQYNTQSNINSRGRGVGDSSCQCVRRKSAVLHSKANEAGFAGTHPLKGAKATMLNGVFLFQHGVKLPISVALPRT
eukprot:2133230-Prymnesium_polylepis.1